MILPTVMGSRRTDEYTQVSDVEPQTFQITFSPNGIAPLRSPVRNVKFLLRAGELCLILTSRHVGLIGLFDDRFDILFGLFRHDNVCCHSQRARQVLPG